MFLSTTAARIPSPFVSRIVSEGIVKLLEVVGVDHQQSQWSVLLEPEWLLLFELLFEEPSICNDGQSIALCDHQISRSASPTG